MTSHYKYQPKDRARIESLEDVLHSALIEKAQQVERRMQRIQDLIKMRKERVVQLDGVSTAASEYLVSRLTEIKDPEQNRMLLAKGLEALIDTIEQQIEEQKQQLTKLINI